MTQFTIYFFAVIGAFSTGFYILNICKWLFKDDKKDDININVKGSLACNSSDIIKTLKKEEERNKRVYGDRFPSNTNH